MGRVFANGPGDRGSIPGQVIPKTQKILLDGALLNTQQYKVRIKDKVYQSRERSRAPLQLGSLLITVTNANQTAGEETWRQLHKNVESNIEQVLATTPHKTLTVRPPASHHENYAGQTSQTRRTLLEKQRRARKWFTTMDPHIWPSKSRTTSPNLHTAAMWGHRM